MGRGLRATRAGALAGRLGRRLGLLVALAALVFVAVEVLPGDAASSSLGREATEAGVVARRVELGLDRPVPVRFAGWLAGVARLDFGTTAHGQAVGEVIGRRFGNTVLLGLLAVVASSAAALVGGALAARRPGRVVDRNLSRLALGALAVPEFVVAGVLVLVLGLWLGLLPPVVVTGPDGWLRSPSMLVLPVLALALPTAGWNVRVVRGALLDAADAPHVETAVLDGLRPVRVLVHHVLPEALPAIAQSVAATAVSLFGGALVVETVLNYPGVGVIVAGAVTARDTPLVAGVVLLTGAVLVAVFALADLVSLWVVGEER